MTWEYVKDKVLVFGEDDYVFANMFIAIIHELPEVEDKETIKLFTYIMLEQLLAEKLVIAYRVSRQELIEYQCDSTEEIKTFIKGIDDEWAGLKYLLPEPNQLFWITSTEKGVDHIKKLITKAGNKFILNFEL